MGTRHFSLKGLALAIGALTVLPLALFALGAWSIAPYANSLVLNLRASTQIAQAPFAERIIIGDSRVALLPDTDQALLVGYGGAPFPSMSRLTGVVCSVNDAPVVVALGANDALEMFIDPDASEAAMRDMVDACGAERITLAGVWAPEPEVPDLGDKFDLDVIADLNARMALVAFETGATYAPPPENLAGHTRDGVHFTPAVSQEYLEALLAMADA